MSNRTGRLCASILAVLSFAALTALASAHGHDQGGHHGKPHGHPVKGHHNGHHPFPHPRHAAHLKHVFVIVLENHSRNGVIGNPNAPYITELAQRTRGRPLLRRHAPERAELHRDDAGDNFGIHNDNPVNLDAQLVDQLEAQAASVGRLHGASLPAGYLALRADRRRLRCTRTSTTRSCCSPTSRTTRPGWQRSSPTPARCRPRREEDAPSSSRSAPTSATTCTAACTTRSPRGTAGPPAVRQRPRTTPTTPPSSRRATRSCSRRSAPSRVEGVDAGTARS